MADATATPEIPYVRQPADFSRPVRYAYGPDSDRQPGVPEGTILDYAWSASRVFPDTNRRYWVYVPTQYTASEPASLMVFQDGHMYLDPEGEVRASVVMDNLIHRGEMPVTIGVFVDPGEPENRNVEYDAFSDAYATFLLTEILPNVRDRYLVTDDPDQWAIAGGSSGGSCAFTVAWTRPDRFRRVLSFLGRFAQIRGGNRYPERGMRPSSTGSAPTCEWLPPSRNVATTSGSSSETAVTTRTTAARSSRTHSAGSGDANPSGTTARKSYCPSWRSIEAGTGSQ